MKQDFFLYSEEVIAKCLVPGQLGGVQTNVRKGLSLAREPFHYSHTYIASVAVFLRPRLIFPCFAANFFKYSFMYITEKLEQMFLVRNAITVAYMLTFDVLRFIRSVADILEY